MSEEEREALAGRLRANAALCFASAQSPHISEAGARYFMGKEEAYLEAANALSPNESET